MPDNSLPNGRPSGNNPGGDRNINSGNHGGNTVNIDRSRNTNVQVNSYHRNMYYNGYRGYYPYHYHPYHPYYYGPAWHPYGFYTTSMSATVVIVSYNSQPYYYDSGVYYVETFGGYTSVPPPANILVQELPEQVESVPADEFTYYYYGGVFYLKTDEGYQVIEAPDGAVVSKIPEGGEEVEVAGQKYVYYNNTYFQPSNQNGKEVYQVVVMEEL